MRMPAVKLSAFWICAAAVALIGVAVTIFDVFAINKFIFFAGYVVLQYVILATAWNIMGGYMGYVNFGTAGSLRWAHTAPSSSTTCSKRPWR